MTHQRLRDWSVLRGLPQEFASKLALKVCCYHSHHVVFAYSATQFCCMICISGIAGGEGAVGISPYFADGNLARFGIGSKVWPPLELHLLIFTVSLLQANLLHCIMQLVNECWDPDFQGAAWTFGADVLVITKSKLNPLVLEKRCNKVLTILCQLTSCFKLT